MHPDYLDYAVREWVNPRAKWHDLKFLVRKITGCELSKIFITHCEWGNDNGWIVELNGIDPDIRIAELRRNLYGVVQIGERAIWVRTK